jgi:hypothetical protein
MGKIAVWAVLYPIVAHIGIQTSHTNLPVNQLNLTQDRHRIMAYQNQYQMG